MMRRSGNPIYHDDPEWYERPGEMVELHVQRKPTLVPLTPLPYRDYGPEPDATTPGRMFPEARRAAMTPTERREVDAGRAKVIDRDHPLWSEALAAYQRGKDAWSAWIDAHPELNG